MAPPIIITEDTPPDMLAGSMDLTVVLPDGHSLKMSVERSMPMMDLLVQVTTANKISPAGHVIRPLNERGTLPYKPSTPIGALDAWTIHVVPKQHAQCTSIKKSIKMLNQPFEQTFRLQVHLPRNQLYVARVSPKTRLADILLQVCSEKNLDPIKYSLRAPNNLDQVLNLSCTLADYKLQEVSLVCNRTHPVEVSSVDIMSLQRETTNPAYRNTMCEGSVSSGSMEGRSLSPAPSDESSASPPPLPPSRPTRKRRPAPKPPTTNQNAVTKEEKQQNGIQASMVTMIHHSRNSSDSSGYHEASVLSESPQSHSVTDSLSRRKMASVSEHLPGESLSQSLTDVAAIQPPLKQATSYNSISSISSGGRKKKNAPPPPPPVVKNKTSSDNQQRTPSVSSTSSSTTTLDGNEGSAAVKSATLPPSSRLNSEPPVLPPSPTHATVDVDVEPPVTLQGTDADLRMADEEIDRIFTNATMNHASLDNEVMTEGVMSSLPSPPATVAHRGSRQPRVSVADDSMDWEYKLPAPPTFRDEAKSPSVTEFGTMTIGNLSDVVCTTVVKQEKDNISEPDVRKFSESYISSSIGVEEMHPEHVTQEPHVDIRQTVIPNITSSGEGEIVVPTDLNNGINKKESVEQNVMTELSSALTHRPSKGDIYDTDKPSQELSSSSTLENFTISTYKDTKPVEVFEDDSIKSSAGEKRDKSKDDAVFRAPKPRVKEPNLSRTSSFSIENKLNGPMIKRSVSYVSLLAANMPRNSEPYRAHLRQHNRDNYEPWPRLRKTTSEVNIDEKGGAGAVRESPIWQQDTTQLQSVQVLRNILSRSQASLTTCIDEPDNISHPYQSDPQTSVQKLEDTMDTKVENNWGRSHSEEAVEKPHVEPVKHSASLDQEESKATRRPRGPPSINLSTWSERPKRQIAVKNDNDSISGFGKKNITHNGTPVESQTKLSAIVSTPAPSNFKANLQPVMATEGFKPVWKSKSITDLSRIPIVRAVELKKPLPSQNDDRSCLKPVQVFDDTPKNNIEELKKSNNSTDDNGDNFIGVNSLAKRFGVPQKRPTSMYVINNNNNYLDNDFKDITQFSKNIVDNRAASKPYGRSESSKSFEEATRLQIKIKSEATSSDIKALSKISSGGFIEDVPKLSTAKQNVNNKMPDKNTYLSRSAINLFSNDLVNCNSTQNDNSNNTTIGNNHTQTVVSKMAVPPHSAQRVITSVFIGQSQTLDRNTRPVSLQPVVKGFRVSSETSNKPKDIVPPTNYSSKVVPSIVSVKERDSSLSSSTEDVNPVNPWAVNLRRTPSQTKECKTSTNLMTTQDLPVHRTTYHRALSTPALPYKDIAKDKLSAAAANTRANSISEVPLPPPPPALPVLRPSSERRGIKLLPPPTANPRDQLMASIRAFSQDHLKRVSK